MKIHSLLQRGALLSSTILTATAVLFGSAGQVLAASDFGAVQGFAQVGAAASTVNKSFTSSVTAGDLIVVTIGQRGTQSFVSTPTDNQSNTYTLLLSQACGQTGSSAQRSAEMWTTTASSTGTLTISFASPNAAYQIVGKEFSGTFGSPLTQYTFQRCGSNNLGDITTDANGTMGSYSTDGLAYQVIQSPNTIASTLRGFGTFTPGNTPAWVVANDYTSTAGDQAYASVQGSIADQYALNTPYGDQTAGNIEWASANQAVSFGVVFRSGL